MNLILFIGLIRHYSLQIVFETPKIELTRHLGLGKIRERVYRTTDNEHIRTQAIGPCIIDDGAYEKKSFRTELKSCLTRGREGIVRRMP